MRTTTLLSALCATLTVYAVPQTAQIAIQPISASSPKAPLPLASVSFDLASPDSTSILSYDAPEIPDSSSLVRIGIYDAKTKSWASGTTVASTENFAKGYSPTITISVNSHGDVVSAALKGVQIDAGQTRDFGPKAVIVTEQTGPQPVLNKPVIVSPEGKKAEEQEEKSFLQKYVLAMMTMMVGSVVEIRTCADFLQVLVDDWYRGLYSSERRWRARQIEHHHEHIDGLIDYFVLVFGGHV